MKIKTIYTLLLLLLIGFGTRVSAQTNAVLNYPVPAKKRVSTQKQNQQNTGHKKPHLQFCRQQYQYG